MKELDALERLIQSGEPLEDDEALALIQRVRDLELELKHCGELADSRVSGRAFAAVQNALDASEARLREADSFNWSVTVERLEGRIVDLARENSMLADTVKDRGAEIAIQKEAADLATKGHLAEIQMWQDRFRTLLVVARVYRRAKANVSWPQGEPDPVEGAWRVLCRVLDSTPTVSDTGVTKHVTATHSFGDPRTGLRG